MSSCIFGKGSVIVGSCLPLLLGCAIPDIPEPTSSGSGRARVSLAAFGRLGDTLAAPQLPPLPKPELPTDVRLADWDDSSVEALVTANGFSPERGDLYSTFIVKAEGGLDKAAVARKMAEGASLLVAVLPQLAFYNDRIWETHRQWQETGRRSNRGLLSKNERIERVARLEASDVVNLPMHVRPLFPGAEERSRPELEMDTYWVVSLPVFEKEVANLHGDALSTLVDTGFNLQAEAGFARVSPRLPPEVWLQSSFNFFTAGDCVVDGEESQDEDPIQGGAGWVRQRLGVPDPETASGEGVRVAHLDVGWGFHPELNFDDPNDTNSNDSFDWRFEKDFSEGDEDAEVDPLDPGLIFAGHGISTASQIVSAPGDELTGIAPDAVLIPIRAVNNVVLDPMAGAPVAEAIWWATHDANADVITMSIGGFGNSWMELAVADAVYNNVIVVAAAGNILPSVVAPAVTPECIAAAGSTVGNMPWNQSARGEGIVTIAAPATDVFSARYDNEDNEAKVCRIPEDGGTSNSTAIISGVAALWLEAFGKETLVAAVEAEDAEATLQELYMQRLRATATVPNGWDTEFGPGIVHAGRLLGEDIADMVEGFEKEWWNNGERRAYLGEFADHWGKVIDWSGLDLGQAAAVEEALQTVDTISRRSAARGQAIASVEIDQAVGGFFATLATVAADLDEVEEQVEEEIEEFQEEVEDIAEEVLETIEDIAEEAEESSEELVEDGCEMVNSLLGMVGADAASC